MRKSAPKPLRKPEQAELEGSVSTLAKIQFEPSIGFIPEELEMVIRRLRKDAEVCARVATTDLYSPEVLSRAADFFQTWMQVLEKRASTCQ